MENKLSSRAPINCSHSQFFAANSISSLCILTEILADKSTLDSFVVNSTPSIDQFSRKVDDWPE